jgi:hypothetical protein
MAPDGQKGGHRMKASIHRIMGDIHHLLAKSTHHELVEASRLPANSRHMKNALLALAKERAEGREIEHRDVAALTFDRSNLAEENKVHEEILESGPPVEDDSLSFVFDIINGASQLQNKKDLVGFARAFKFKFNVKPDDTRNAVAKRLARAIHDSPKDVQSQAINAIFSGRLTPATNWSDAIRDVE